MRISLIFRVISGFLLLIFLYTTCNQYPIPEIEKKEPITIYTVPVGLGDIGTVFLDEFYQPTTNDIGKLALFVENNEYAEGVIVVSEIVDNHIDNDTVVRIINGHNDSITSFYYHNYQQFPYKIIMSIDGEDVIANFSPYDTLSETYAVEFFDDDGESEWLEGFKLAKEIFLQYTYSDILTETQNVRLQSLYTTFELWLSFAFHIDHLVNEDSNARFLNWKKVSNAFYIAATVFVAVVVVAACVVAIPALVPAAAAVITPAVIAVANAVWAYSATAAIACTLLGIASEAIDNAHSSPPPSENRRVQIEIVDLSGEKIRNNHMPPAYLEQGESFTFEISITDPVSFSYLQDIINPNDFITSTHHFAHLTSVETSIMPGAILQTTITRNFIYAEYSGIKQYIIHFLTDAIINGVSTGITAPWDAESNQKDIYLLNIGVR